ncbi:Crp/Fnr family transcriptional regulator [Arthrobacter sp. Cr_A7]|uniref:Crp/Fnr family transcriptional regulator n=1 Tax=Arthrobacter sp. Cr_A7 TaxID=3031017 RepID=UPI0023DB4BF9|nr:Crp/Fnr family transcriptional regulator [Arthrobacter sp. Cr_A7]MDF2051183.1 Crp/Fnr family transcriptional regulator [Arthrobacter sp. Cr_A7]
MNYRLLISTSHETVDGLAMDADVLKAIEVSHLHEVAPESLRKLLAGAQCKDVPTRTVTHREGDRNPHLELILSGVVRVFVRAPDGRTLTIRYCRPGSLLGAGSLFAADFSLPASLQTLTATKLLSLLPENVHRSVNEDPKVALALLEELSERVLTFIYEIPDSAFASVRQRIARHMLDLASELAPEQVRVGQELNTELVVTASQSELAEAVGTAREVVVRILRELRHEGIVHTGRTGIVILDPARLVQETRWNIGS